MKKSWSIPLVLALITNGCNCGVEDELEFVCPQPTECYVLYGKSNTEKNIITGEKLLEYEQQVCSFGKTVCDQENKQITCEDIEYSRQEICDGIDNDCNGFIDDGEHLVLEGHKLNNPCHETQKGVCKFSEAHCEVGNWVCLPPRDLYGEEICDGFDNDCDGLVDEDIQNEFVYTGPPETLNIGECRAGVQTCVDGQIVNFGMVTPVLEICGNDDDDDCDGLTDERENDYEEYDFALIIDVSGSMTSFLYSVKHALCDWENDERFQSSKFAILAVATNDIPHGTRVISDFVNAGDACVVLDTFLNSAFPTIAQEYQLDAVIKSMTIGDDIEISWSSNRKKKIVLFTDEEPQFLMPPNPDPNGQFPTIESKIDEIIQACISTETTVNVFTSFFASWNVYWRDMTSSCNGYLEYLSFDHYTMLERINYWFGDEC